MVAGAAAQAREGAGGQPAAGWRRRRGCGVGLPGGLLWDGEETDDAAGPAVAVGARIAGGAAGGAEEVDCGVFEGRRGGGGTAVVWGGEGG